MQIEWVAITGFRNFKNAVVNLSDKTLLIGANDVGKTNFLYAIRLLLDRSIPEAELDPQESDFHISLDGEQVSELKIQIKLRDIHEDAVLSKLKGNVNDSGVTFLTYTAMRDGLSYKVFVGHGLKSCEEIDSRFYLRHIHFKYVQSSRDLGKYIRTEKRHLLKISKDERNEEQQGLDAKKEVDIQGTLSDINKNISNLSYVKDATLALNEELKKLSHHHSNYSVGLEANTIDFSNFIDQLHLGACTSGRSVGLGGDGRNNQILVSLWKAKSEIEHDIENEAVIYCIEEPEVHLHPHQQRKLASYLVNELMGQVLVSSHSPQITSEFSPDGIVHFFERGGSTIAANEGCSSCVESAWKNMGYRMSILPAEAFFSDAVLLVEGPSEILFYGELANKLEIDLDFHNISILSVHGVDFEVYIKILDAMEIPWVMRTDNDVFKVPYSNPPRWRFAGLNRALKIAAEKQYENHNEKDSPLKLDAEWKESREILEPKGIYVAQVDLENDLSRSACADALFQYSSSTSIDAAVKYLQQRKAIRMGEFVRKKGDCLLKLHSDVLVEPLRHVVHLANSRKSDATKV